MDRREVTAAPETSLTSGPPAGPSFQLKLFLLLPVVVIVVFHPVLSGDLAVWDDDINTSGNPHLEVLNWEHVK